MIHGPCARIGDSPADGRLQRFCNHRLRLLPAFVVVLAAGTMPPIRAADAPPQAVEMVVALLGEEDPLRRAIGLEAVRYGTAGTAATLRYAAILAGLSPERQAELLTALADRADSAALPAARQLQGAAMPAVRAAALRVLGAVGGADEVPLLVGALGAAGEERAAAVRGLEVIGSAAAARAVREAAGPDAAAPARAALIEILAVRRDKDAAGVFVGAAVADDAAVRKAALEALARLGGPGEVDGVVAAVLAAAAGGDRDRAERTLVAICSTNTGHPAAAEALLRRFSAASSTEQAALLPALAKVGGSGPLAIVDALVADTDPARRRQGLEALAVWRDASVSERLLDQLGRTELDAERDLLVDGLIRIAPRPDNGLDDAKRLGLLQRTMELCRRDEDRARVLERAHAIRTVETLRFVAEHLDDPALARSACLSVVELAHHQKLREDHRAEFVQALDTVIATAKDPEHVERATAYKEGRTWERKKG